MAPKAPTIEEMCRAIDGPVLQVPYDFLISPVRQLTPEVRDRMDQWAAVHCRALYIPHINNPYEETDRIGLEICRENIFAMKNAEHIYVWWMASSQGSVFDIGAAMALGKIILLANPEELEVTPQKSFANVLMALHTKNTAAGEQ